MHTDILWTSFKTHLDGICSNCNTSAFTIGEVYADVNARESYYAKGITRRWTLDIGRSDQHWASPPGKDWICHSYHFLSASRPILPAVLGLKRILNWHLKCGLGRQTRKPQYNFILIGIVQKICIILIEDC
jgi:hypothetical protein